MKKAIQFTITYHLACLGIFLCIQKPVFIAYNLLRGSSACSLSDIADIYRHGLSLDVATAAYLTAIPLLLICTHMAFPRFNPGKPLSAYNMCIAALLAVVTVADACLYEFWDYTRATGLNSGSSCLPGGKDASGQTYTMSACQSAAATCCPLGQPKPTSSTCPTSTAYSRTSARQGTG